MKKKPMSIWLLAASLAFLGIGGLYGGTLMLMEPTGSLLKMDSVLHDLPVDSYVLPGLFLIGFMGTLPLMLAYAVIKRPHGAKLQRLFSWSPFHWAWTATICLCTLLDGWLMVQAVFIGFSWPMQWVTAINGQLIFLIALLPGVRGFFRLPKGAWAVGVGEADGARKSG